MYGHYQENLDSEFLSEIDDGLIDHQGLSQNRTQSSRPERINKAYTEPVVEATYQPIQHHFTIGDKVQHKMFGDGVVVMVDKDKVTIAFKAEYGIKVLMKDHPSIQKK